MEFQYKPKSDLEKFGVEVYNLLVDNFPQTFFVGGMVRDLLLGKKVTDIDIATETLPTNVVELLKKNTITFDDSYQKYGAVIAKRGIHKIEITTLRKDQTTANRYPKVSFVKNAKIDSQRRDFSINALYLSLNDGKILDFNNGIKDIKRRIIRFIGNPNERIKEDPLRILRALRFSMTLKFNLEHYTYIAIKKHFNLLNTLTETKKINEIAKIKSKKQKILIKNILCNPKLLDKYFK